MTTLCKRMCNTTVCMALLGELPSHKLAVVCACVLNNYWAEQDYMYMVAERATCRYMYNVYTCLTWLKSEGTQQHIRDIHNRKVFKGYKLLYTWIYEYMRIHVDKILEI